MSRRSAGRVTRQILSGSQLTQPRDSFPSHKPTTSPGTLAYRYLLALSALVIIASLVWAVWGMGPASIVLLILALGLLASWLVL